MMRHEQLGNGLYVPALSPERGSQIKEMVESPMMQYLMFSVFNAWAVNEGNHRTAWNSPVYAQLALVQEITMQGIDLIRKADGVPQSKAGAVTSMLARGVSLARLSCLSLDMGSFSDAYSNFRMLFEREMTIRYLEAKNQYEGFAKAFYAEIFILAGESLNDQQLRQGSSSIPSDLEQYKQIREFIRREHFDNKRPKEPKVYWSRPTSKQLADEYAKGMAWKPEEAMYKKTMRVYNLGNQSVHPRLRDLIQPEESDISAEDLRSLILLTLGGLAMFGLSLFEESSPLVSKIEEIIAHPPSGISIFEMLQANAGST